MTARVPFALVGVVLLLGSTTLAGSIHQPALDEPDVDRELERVGGETQTALRDAVTTAAREAASDPVTRRADTDYGRALNETSPFRDTLRVRIYLKLREKLAAISTTHDGIETAVVLPSIDSPSEMREAKKRIHVERRENGTGLRVTVENVTLTATRNGKRVAERRISPTVVVPTPTLAVHDRVSLYERRLNAGAVRPGLGRRLTASLYPIVWMRGYAQYGGTPIENVLANRHVSLFTNRAVLSLQRDVFGHSDPTGRAVFQRAFADAALSDVLSGVDTSTMDILKKVHKYEGLTPDPAGKLGGTDALGDYPRPEETITIGVNETADHAFLLTVSHMNETLRNTYSADAELTVSVDRLSNRSDGRRNIPDTWTLRRNETTTNVSVSNRSAKPPALANDTHRLAFHPRTVERTTTTRRVWETPNGSRRTVDRRVETFAVDLTLTGSHFRGPAPVRPIPGIHERGGPFDGPNLREIPRKAQDRLITERGGPDAVAKRVISERPTGLHSRIYGDRPAELREWVYTDLARLREQVANVSVTTTRGKLATFRANPARKLAQRLRERRSEFVDAPTSYGSVAERARIAARAAYVDRLITHFEWRARAHRANRADLNDALTEAGGHSMNRTRRNYDHRTTGSRPTQTGGIRMRVHASPAYLTTGAVDSDAVPALPADASGYPLVVRNWNAITLPYGNVADKVVGALMGPDKTRLRTAAQTLATIERSGSTRMSVPSKLRAQVGAGVDTSATAARETLASFDLGDEETRRAVVTRGLERWKGLGGRALAVTNGSAATRIHELAVDRWGDQLSTAERDLLSLRLEEAMIDAATNARPNEPPVETATGKFRKVVRAELSSKASSAAANITREKLEELTGRQLSRLPAGLPVAPAPGLWYATVNLWQVRVRGEYVRFAVSVPRGTPDEPGARLLYVRDGRPVGLDIDGDGEPERLGRSSRVSFGTGTDVAIAVPPGVRGVGDVDGQADERSDGWPRPGGW